MIKLQDFSSLLSTAKSELRNANLQQGRRAMIAASLPLRRGIQSAARPQVSSAIENRPVWGIREVGDYDPVPTAHGYSMPVRAYDQSTAVVSLDDGSATFRNLHALDGQRRVLYEQQLSFGTLPISLKALEPIEEHHASVAYLSNTAPSNFYHWFFFILPFLRFYDAAGVEPQKFYLGEDLNEWQRRSLDFVGLTEDQIITRPCSADVAHVAIATRWINGVPPDQIRWVRSSFVAEEPPKGHRRLFVGRGTDIKNRSMFDEEVVAAALEKEFGFEYMTTSGLTLDQEIEMFGQAESVVAPLGSALTNLLFAPKGTKVLELAPYDNDFSAAQCFQELSTVFRNPHGVIRGEPTQRKRRGLQSHIKIPLDTILSETEKMLSS